eukprot:TRINITY_DN3040_c0_g1_i3.p1 TRINITY_DN3040_c0_g1~~TRINITY_DN3040_c0_g1_i3.p1  ORF type:complete len:393 (-),score=98.37 TRINITY_DN3040_c0_g1_i3:1340-2518(-)
MSGHVCFTLYNVKRSIGAFRNVSIRSGFSTSADLTRAPPKTAVLMMNMGGPATQEDVHPFLLNLFADRDLIVLPWQSTASRFIAARRTPRVKKQYAEIGGGSPIRRWTEAQGAGMVRLLDVASPFTAPHAHYVAFRYAAPLTDETLMAMKADGVKRVVAFTQYPQYSCSTTGSSLNQLFRRLKALGLENEFEWSLVDRWPTSPALVKVFAKHIREALDTYPAAERHDVVLLFSAHSLPMKVVDRGDPYPQEVGATVHAIMEELNFSHEYRLSYQSKVGPLPWLGPKTLGVLQGLASHKRRNVLVVPVAFTTDHIETLYELDLEYGREARELGLTGYKRVESLNADPDFIQGLATMVDQHLNDGKKHSKQLPLRCPGCTNAVCADMRQFFCAQ